jgi:hypothetical protein
MPDRPHEMYRNGRPIVPDFDPGELFYHRIQPGFVQEDGSIDPVHISSLQCPDISSNRSRFSEPWFVLYPRARYGGWAVYKFQTTDLPEVVQADAPGATVYSVKTEHDPEDDNYGHCETRVYRGDEKMASSNVNRNAKNKLRLSLARALKIARKPGEQFPPD